MKELGGDEDWEYKYVEPVAGENDKMKDTATKDKLVKEREAIVEKFEALTVKWIDNPTGQDASGIKEEREATAKQLKEHYWTLDPYLRARSLYDRRGDISPDGRVDWYAKNEAAEAKPAIETSADDVD